MKTSKKHWKNALVLWYKKPANEWKEGLPVGNGRLAAMVMGFPETERIALNHEGLWRGANRDRDNEDVSRHLGRVRELLLNGKYEEGTILANKVFAGKGGISGEKSRIDSYQPAGDLYFKLDHGPVDCYSRMLNLEDAIVSVQYETNGVRILREIIAHMKHNLIIVRISSSGGKISGSFWLDRVEDPGCHLAFKSENKSMWMDGLFDSDMGFRVKADFRVKDGSFITEAGRRVKIIEAEEILIFLSISISINDDNFCTGKECCSTNILAEDWNSILKSHVREYAKYYNRFRLEIPMDENNMPTDERILEFRKGKKDIGLPALYFNYGRYLLIASSLNCELPANLQGKWNEEVNPPWQCDYHMNINLQMNYWITEQVNLPECSQVLFKFIEGLVPHGKKAAKDLYGCRGVFFPLTTDAWKRATPESYGWAVWVGAAAWMALHMWRHYEYGQDINFLKNHAYPFIKEVAMFFEDYLIKDKNGIYQIVPSQSPENRFVESGNLLVSLCVSSSIDIQLVQMILQQAVKSSELLEVDCDRRDIWQEILKNLPELRIGSSGQLLEWNEEFEEAEPGHRHISHLFGLYPGDLFTPEKTPKLYKAACTSLENRLKHGSGYTGWSRAWIACCFAKMRNGEKAWEHLIALLSDFCTSSLLSIHPPEIFQIDGNLGGAAAVLEMLFQSYNEVLHFLPALPREWPEGKITGARAIGGYTVDFEWHQGKLSCARIVPLKDNECIIFKTMERYCITDNMKRKVQIRDNGLYISFNVKKGYEYFIEVCQQ